MDRVVARGRAREAVEAILAHHGGRAGFFDPGGGAHEVAIGVVDALGAHVADELAPAPAGEERHVVVPIPAVAGVGVVAGAAVAAAIGVGHLVVADDVAAIERHALPRGDVAGERRGARVELIRVVAALRDVAFVLDAHAAQVHVPISGVPGHIGLAHHLGDGAVGAADHVVGARARRAVLEPRGAPPVGALHGVDDDHVDVGAAARVVAVVLAAGLHVGLCARVVGGARRRRHGPAHRHGLRRDPRRAEHALRLEPPLQERVDALNVEVLQERLLPPGEGAQRGLPRVEIGGVGQHAAVRGPRGVGEERRGRAGGEAPVGDDPVGIGGDQRAGALEVGAADLVDLHEVEEGASAPGARLLVREEVGGLEADGEEQGRRNARLVGGALERGREGARWQGQRVCGEDQEHMEPGTHRANPRRRTHPRKSMPESTPRAMASGPR